jgi:catechol 2,3-dioxygenase-like lactoylglutathione lyase family enzyme
MFDHIGIDVSQLDKSVRFYEAALAPLGFRLEANDPKTGTAGFGTPGAAAFWIAKGNKAASPLHLAFQARSRGSVRQFYEAAMAAGGKDNGKPGLRETYGPTYYAAFVIDPDGHNVEAVCQAAE